MRRDSGQARVLAGAAAALAMALALGSGIVTTRRGAEAGCTPATPPWPAAAVDPRAAAPVHPPETLPVPGPAEAAPVARVEAPEPPAPAPARDLEERLRALAVG
jgi:hypothetical protein